MSEQWTKSPESSALTPILRQHDHRTQFVEVGVVGPRSVSSPSAMGVAAAAGATAAGGARRRALGLGAGFGVAGVGFATAFLAAAFTTRLAVFFTAVRMTAGAVTLGGFAGFEVRCALPVFALLVFFRLGAVLALARRALAGLDLRACFQALRAAPARLRARRTSRLAS
jgi:hypothetical protein